MPLIVATTFAQQPSATHQGSARKLLGQNDFYYTYTEKTIKAVLSPHCPSF